VAASWQTARHAEKEQTSMKTIAKFYGTRGSTPVCDREFQDFGGNTTCVMLKGADGRVAILDAGSGIRNLGKDLIATGHHQEGTMFIALSHFHWDHIQGFPFFAPAYDAARHFTIGAFGRAGKTKDLKSIFAGQLQQEYFPIPLEQMGATFAFLEPGGETFEYGPARVTSCRHQHPGGAYTFRIESHGKILVFCTDIEHGDRIDPNVVKISKEADLLIHDAQYTPEELRHKKGWGHSSWEQAVEVAKQAGVKRLALTHHDPDHNDEFLLRVEEECQRHFAGAVLAREKMTIEL
jgi:phosphoribosyl 1,2-cyclic phosphodiesterase